LFNKIKIMKTFSIVLTYFLLLFVLIKPAFAQTSIVPVDEDTKLITYKDVVTQEGDKTKLYYRAIEWVNANYKNPTEVTRVRDEENGKLELRASFKVFNTDKKGFKTDAAVINYILKLEFKPGKYRYIFTDFSIAAVSKYPLERWLDKKDPRYTPACEDYLAQVDSVINVKIESLKEGMVPKVIKKDDW
jgi:hypothetical protein